MNIKRKIAVLILSVIYVLSSATATEFFKLPVLIKHYLDHRKENPTITAGTFLAQHYYYEKGTDKDAEEDNRLPFKSAENTSPVTLVSLTPPAFTELQYNPNKNIKRIFGIYKKQYHPSQYLNNIWQPPRSCVAFTV